MDFRYSFFVIDKTLAVSCEGDLLGLGREKNLFRLAEDMVKAGCTSCSMDLSSVRYMNSKGLSLLIRFLTLFRNNGGEMILIRPTSKANKLLTITKLDKIFSTADSRGEALVVLAKA